MKLSDALKLRRTCTVNARVEMLKRSIVDQLSTQFNDTGVQELKFTAKSEYVQDEIVAETLAYFTNEGLTASFDRDSKTFTVSV